MNNPLEIIQALICSDGVSQTENNSNPKALAWARVSTDMQDAKGLSMPEQLKQIREYAEKNNIEIVREYSEAASAYQSNSKRPEFEKMLKHSLDDPEISIILIHDYSRFSRDSMKAKSLMRQLKEKGIRIISLNDPDFDTETVAGVYMEAITFAKNEAYSKEVAFHTRKGCRANVNTRDEQTGWCYKNGGIPLWGYKAVRLQRGFERKGIPIIKVIWDLDDTIVAGRPVHEWVRYCLVELAMKGASLAEIRDFCERQGIPATKNKHWSLSTIKSFFTAPVLLKYAGYEVWDVRRKNGSFKPVDKWVIVEKAHPAIISEDEAREIAEMRTVQSREKRFDKGFGRSRTSDYVLSGGLFVCGRCGSNMTGFKKDKQHPYYICGSIQYRKGAGCSAGVYIPQDKIEDEVIEGLTQLMQRFTSKDGLTAKVNRELKRVWEEKTGVSRNSDKELGLIEKKIRNIYQAIENGLPYDPETNNRLSVLNQRKREIEKVSRMNVNPPRIDIESVLAYKSKFDRILQSSDHADRKKFVRECVDKIELDPERLEVEISYKVPKPVVDYLVAGGGFEPPTFGL
jgi:site-specific DNA recombinase